MKYDSVIEIGYQTLFQVRQLRFATTSLALACLTGMAGQGSSAETGSDLCTHYGSLIEGTKRLAVENYPNGKKCFGKTNREFDCYWYFDTESKASEERTSLTSSINACLTGWERSFTANGFSNIEEQAESPHWIWEAKVGLDDGGCGYFRIDQVGLVLRFGFRTWGRQIYCKGVEPDRDAWDRSLLENLGE